MADENSVPVRLALIEQRITAVEKREEKYVTQEQFFPVKTLVYALVGIMLSSSLGAILALVYKASP